MHFICRPFIGKNNPSHWSQYWENEPDDLLKLTKGHLFGLIIIKSDQSEAPIIIGRELISKINELYFSQEDQDINLSLKKSLEIFLQDPAFLKYQISLALVVISRDRVYLATYGQANCFLQRDGKICLLAKGQDQQITSSCGPVLENDRYFLTSSRFLDVFTFEKIKTILVDAKIQVIEENILAIINSLPDQNEVSAVLIQCHQDTQIVDENLTSLPQENPPLQPPPPTPPVIPISNSFQKPPEVYLTSQPNFKVGRRKKIQLIVALVLIIGLSISIYFGHQKNKLAKAESSFNLLKTELEQKMSSIEITRGMNLETAAEIAKEAKTLVNNMAKLNIYSQEVSSYQSQIDAILSQTGSDEAIDAQMIRDTSSIVSQPQFSSLFFNKNNLYLLDPTKGRIDTFDTQNRSTQNIIISDSIKSADKLLFNNDLVYLLKDDKLYLVEKNNLSLAFDFSSISDSLSVTDITFWNSALYVLDNQSQTIWKLTPNSSGFSEPQKWIKNNLKLEIGANSLAIDGQVWVLNHSGEIELYTSGAKDTFNQKQSTSFIKTFSLVTYPQSDYLVFNDNSEFLYVYHKNGDFKSKYNIAKYKIIDFTFNPTNKTIYFLSSDQKIHQIIL